MARHPIAAATERAGVEPGSPEWFKLLTGSKIAAVMGLSPYESPFSLHLRMEGAVEPQPVNDQKARGHYLEPAIKAWFRDQHPTWRVSPSAMWVSKQYPRYAYSPDGLIKVGRSGCRLAEWKSAAADDLWGQPGTDEIPVYYRCQLQWGLGLLGLEVAHVAVITTRLVFAEYVVEFDPEDFAVVLAAADEFMDRLDRGVRPDIDTHDETYRVIKESHPDIDGTAVQVPFALARDYTAAKHAEVASAAEAKRQTSLLAEHMGSAAAAMYGDVVLARRQAKQGGTPYLVVGKNLPLIDDEMLEAS